MDLRPARISSDRAIYIIAIVASLLLSAWCAYAQQVPNPDALYYLRAAELFRAGEWQQGLAVYRWPFLSLTIAAVMLMTGADAYSSAQLTNALFDGMTVVTFIALVGRLGADARVRAIAGWAALIIVLHPRLSVMRPVIVRDHGYYAFFLLSLYLTVRDLQHRNPFTKLAIVASILTAALFRLEALLLLVIVPAFHLIVDASRTRRSIVVAGSVLVVGISLVLAYMVWMSATIIPAGLSGELNADLVGRFRDVGNTMRERAARLAEVLPPGRNVGIIAYVGYSLATLVEALLRALSIPLAILAAVAFVPRRLLSDFATQFVAWFAGWQVLLLLAFVILAFFLDWRFGMIFTLIMTVPATFTIAEIATQWNEGRRGARYLLPIALLALLVPWLLSVPRYSTLEHLREAGRWVGSNLPPDARILTNDGRIAYFSGRAFDQRMILKSTAETSDRVVNDADFLVIEVTGDRPPPFVTSDLQARMVAAINGANNRSVRVYRIR